MFQAILKHFTGITLLVKVEDDLALYNQSKVNIGTGTEEIIQNVACMYQLP